MINRIRTLGSRDDLTRWIALVVICFGQLMIVLDATIVNVALPSIERDLGFGEADLTWVVNAYAIAYAGFVLLAGRLGDLVGRKRVFLAGVVLFTLASAACGLAASPAMLITARFVQGVGGALSSGVIIAMIVTGFPEARQRAQAMSVFAFTIAGGGSLGLLAGGFLTQAVSWHWVFFINLPIGLATFLAGLKVIGADRGLGLGRGVDVIGSILVTAGLMLGVYAIVTAAANGWASAHTAGFGAASILILAGFLWLQTRRRNPIMPLRILRIRSLAGASAARGLLATGMFTTFFLGAIYLQQVLGLTALQTGLAFLPFTLGLGLLSLGVTVRLVGRFGARRVVLPGLLLVAAALSLHATAGPDTEYFPRLFIAYSLFGFGAGLAVMPLTLLAMSEVPAEDAGLAAGISNVALQVGAALGLAVIGSVAAAAGYQVAFVIAAAVVGLALTVVLVVPRAPRPHVVATVDAEDDAALQVAA